MGPANIEEYEEEETVFNEIFNLPEINIPSPVPPTPHVNLPDDDVFNFKVPFPNEPLPLFTILF